MAYERKTRDVFEIMANYGCGWKVECTCSTAQEARNDLKSCRENGSGRYFIQKRRVKIELTAEPAK